MIFAGYENDRSFHSHKSKAKRVVKCRCLKKLCLSVHSLSRMIYLLMNSVWSSWSYKQDNLMKMFHSPTLHIADALRGHS